MSGGVGTSRLILSARSRDLNYHRGQVEVLNFLLDCGLPITAI
jgi:hypothetical protein